MGWVIRPEEHRVEGGEGDGFFDGLAVVSAGVLGGVAVDS